MSDTKQMPKTEQEWAKYLFPKKEPDLKKLIEKNKRDFKRTPPAADDVEERLKYRRGDGSLNSQKLLKGR